jgi:ADP-ribose pyrophosphatase YjhB (NUDIX family)
MILSKKEREKIFSLFLDNTKLKFSQIEKSIKLRSNLVAYHLEKLQKENLIEKKGSYYYLTKQAEKYLPVIPHILGKELSPLPVILVALLNKDKILLLKRNNRPYKNYWGLLGGKILLEENFKKACIRKVKEESSIDCKFISLNAVLHEQVNSDDVVKHSFILFFTKARTSSLDFKESPQGKLKWFSLTDLDKEKIIPSDLWLIKNKLNSKIDVKSASMKESNNKLSFKIV